MWRSKARRGEENEDPGEGRLIHGTLGAVRGDGTGNSKWEGPRRETSLCIGPCLCVDAGALEFWEGV